MGGPARTGSETKRSCTLKALECGSEAAALCIDIILHLIIYNRCIALSPRERAFSIGTVSGPSADLPTCPSAYPNPSSTELAQI